MATPTKTKTKTIQIVLPDGEPRGVRIAEVTTGMVQAVQVPRTKLKEVMGWTEINQIGVYFLFGDSDEQAKPLVYIGQTEGFDKRLNRHLANLGFWTTAVLLISRTNS